MIITATVVLAAGVALGLPTNTEPWATDAWIDFAAHIVASEARNVPSADIVVACTLLRDIKRGWHPWDLRKRWFGYGPPDDKDRAAVLDALYTSACRKVPHYKYVGNIRDVYHWRAVKMIGGGPFDLFVGPTGSTVVGVPYRAPSSRARLTR